MKFGSIKSLKTGDPKEVSKLYNDYRDQFFFFGRKYGLNNDDLSDIYQEAFIALRAQAIKGKLDNLKSTLKTYLFGIGKFMIYDRLKEKNKTVDYQATFQSIDDSVNLIDVEIEREELTIEQQLLRTHFKKLGKKCKEVLTLFYARGLTIDEIVAFTNYTKSSVVRSQKSRCIKTLKEMIKS